MDVGAAHAPPARARRAAPLPETAPVTPCLTEDSAPVGPQGSALTRRGFLRLAGTSAAVAAATACLPTRESTPPAPGPREVGGPQVIRPHRTLVLAASRIASGLSGIGNSTTPDAEAQWLSAAGLCTIDCTTLETKPWLAEERPSLQRGTWQINPDGTMVTTWRLRSGVTWHDGTPLTSRDFAFGWEVLTDERVVVEGSRSPANLIERVETPDDRTLVLRWRSRFALASGLTERDLTPVPRHLLEPLYRSGDYEQFNNHRYWSSGFFHTGPYRLVEYEPGVQMTFEAYDGYSLGRPKIDRIVWRLIEDSNTFLAALLSGAVDVGFGLPIEQGLVIEREWGARAVGSTLIDRSQPVRLNPSPTSPIFGWQAPNQQRIREAMLHAINREEMAQTLGQGKERVVHLPLSFNRPEYAAGLAAGRTYPHDPGRAQRLFEEAGWRRGPDGVLANERGERFSVELRTTAGRKDLEAAELVVADYLKQAGIETTIRNLSTAQQRTDEFRGRWPGLFIDFRGPPPEGGWNLFSSRDIPAPENSWTGNNLGGWVNAEVDRLLSAYANEIDDRRRAEHLVAISTLVTQELPYLPLISTSEMMAWRSSVAGIPTRADAGGSRNNRTWNVQLWEKLS